MREVEAEDKFDNVYAKLLWAYNDSRPTADPSAVEQILAKHSSVLDHIRKGVQCGMARYPYHWSLDHIRPGVQFGDPDFPTDREKDWGFWNPDFKQSRINALSLALAKQLRANGKEMEAAELMLDMCMYSRDQQHDNLRPDCGIAGLILNVIRDILLSGRLSKAELEQVDRELGVLVEASANLSLAHWNNLLGRGMYIRREARYGRQLRFCQLENGEITAGWRDFHSYKLMDARAFHLLEGWTRTLAAAENEPWETARRLVDGVRESADRAGPAMEMLSEVSTSGLTNRRRDAAKLRILRVATRFLVAGETLTLADPFGSGPLKLECGEKLKVWSVGWCGSNPSGRGSWKGYYGENLVLELPADR
ncbi:MAG TPA: hypothetical protein VJU16_01940 [Planctomycetota bacterium]|nr:hypothetical protein [Planctomycetota bacterium]